MIVLAKKNLWYICKSEIDIQILTEHASIKM